MNSLTQELVHRCKKNERAAMAELFSILAPKMKGICYRYSGNTSDAEDLLQESFITIFSKINTFKEIGSFEGWARRITVNTSLNWLRKNKQLLQMTQLSSKHEAGVNNEVDDAEESEIGITTDELMQNIAQLPHGYRTILNLFAIEGYSHKEIGEQLGINESTSRSQYTRAKQALQQLFVKKKINEKL